MMKHQYCDGGVHPGEIRLLQFATSGAGAHSNLPHASARGSPAQNAPSDLSGRRGCALRSMPGGGGHDVSGSDDDMQFERQPR